MASPYVKFNVFTGDVLLRRHNFDTDVFHVVLTNLEPDSAVDEDIGDIVGLPDGNGYPGDGLPSATSLSSIMGTASVEGTAAVFTADGGTVGPFRYAVLYNYTQPTKRLIAYWDYGVEIVLNDTESVTVLFPAGIFSLS